MQAGLMCWMLLFAHTPMPGTAADVGYQLDVKSFTVSDLPKIDEVTAIEIRDRTWATAGIEEALGDRAWSGTTGWDPSWNRRIVYETTDPVWAHEKPWPRTCELLGRGEFCQKMKFEHYDGSGW